MAGHNHKLEIFRGRLKFKSNVQKIWGVLIFLSIITIVEVALGIIKPEILLNYFFGTHFSHFSLSWGACPPQ